MPGSPDEAVRYLRTPRAIRDRCENVFERGLDGRLDWFAVDLGRLPDVAARVARLTERRFPDLRVPYHSRWAHFRAGGVDRVERLWSALDGMADEERGRAGFDLVVTSVLLDAGAGPDWSYRDPESAETFARSEGLAIASLSAFRAGLFSSDPGAPLRADARGLSSISEASLADAFQVSDDNPLVGLAGRVLLMRRLGDAVRGRPDLFGSEARVGGLFDHLLARAEGGRLPATVILDVVLEGLGTIWPGRVTLGGVNLGDVWSHPAAGGEGHGAGLVPFHKLSQWLSYSLVEALELAGLDVVDLDELTGLAEYRNGGLLVDGEVLVTKRPEMTAMPFAPDAEPIVEWRALTVALLDRLADEVRGILGKTRAQMPLANVLEGGTWHAGREIAAEKRPGGGPPIQVRSDGTVF